MGLIYTSQKSRQSYKKGVKPYSKPKRIPTYEQGILTVSKPFVRETVNYPSLMTTGFSACVKKEDKVYTGDKVVGIGTMHKSNVVPIFNNNEAKDIASMRRN